MVEFLEGLWVSLSSGPMGALDYAVLIGYFVLLMVVGYLCRNSSGNVSDYICMGCKGTWWLTGMSIFMSSFAASMFSASASQAYLGGWSILVQQWFMVLVFVYQGAFLAPWMRRTRAVTPGDAIYSRFGRLSEQVLMYTGVPIGMIWTATMLLGLAKFVAPVFGMPVEFVLISASIVILFYNVTGGAWSAQITDNLQAFILIPVTVAVACLCLWHVGGVDGLFEAIRAKGLEADFAGIKPVGHEYTYVKEGLSGEISREIYTLPWLLIMGLYSVIHGSNIAGNSRYLSPKTDRDASKAAYFAGFLTFVSSLFWFVPPIYGRLFLSEQIEATASLGLKNPGEAAYAVTAMNVMPPGLIGIVVVCMFAATLAAMDGCLTGNAGLIVRNIYPPLMRVLGIRELTGRPLLLFTKILNLLLGVVAITVASALLWWEDAGGLFKIFLSISVLVGPFSLPFVLSFFVRRLPFWAPIVGMVTGGVAAFAMEFGRKLCGWTFPYDVDQVYHYRLSVVFLATVVPTLLTRFFWFTATDEFKGRVDEFFVRVHTPIDFRSEVGKEQDAPLARMVGRLGMIVGACFLFLAIPAWLDDSPHAAEGVVAVVGIAAFIVAISLVYYVHGVRRGGRVAAADQHDRLEAVARKEEITV
jgi:Na+/proline symporter